VTVRIEDHAPGPWVDGLRRCGHEVERSGAFEHGFGHAHVIEVSPEVLAGASDPRPRTGSASGW
jgi:gamma-glutamyltranspeptidase